MRIWLGKTKQIQSICVCENKILDAIENDIIPYANIYWIIGRKVIMHISKVNVFNYRLLNQTSVSCEKDLSLIIGKNNCGKTSFLSVLSKCIGNKSEVGNFDFNDFSTLFQKKLYKVVKGESTFKEEELTGIRVDL